MKPTEEEIKRFWEWCGFYYRKDKDPLASFWETKDGRAWGYELPRIDLNNLFKYAVPKIEEIGLDIELKRTIEPKWQVIISNYTDRPPTMGNDDNPALALFWAIYKVVEGG